jgi:RHS repeat-associated protein
MDVMMNLRAFLVASFFLLTLASAQSAQACGTYQTCNMILIQDVRVTPSPAESGQPVTIEIDTFEFANWYYTVNSMLFQPQIIVTIGGRQHVASLSDSSIGPATPYGYWMYGIIWYTQYASYTHTLTWDGKDSNGAPATGDQEAIIVAYAGSAMDGRTVLIELNGDVGKNDGANCEPDRIPPQVGDPCNVTTGNTYRYESDYRSGNGELRFARSYNSRQAGNDHGLGHGWIALALRHLEVSDDRIVVREADGRAEAITKTNGSWQADADSKIHLSEGADGYTLARIDGTVEQYSSTGHLVAAADRNGRTTRYQYDPNDRLIAISSPDGHTLGLDYLSDGHMASITDPAGGSILFGYDSAGNLTSVTYQDGTSRHYLYEDPRHPNHLTGVTDERGVLIAGYEYDDTGRATLTTHAMRDDGQYHDAYTLEYVDESHTRVTDGKGNRVEYTIEENLGVRNIVSRIDLSDGKGMQQQFDERNNLVRSIDWQGDTTQFEYNDSNELIRKTEASGTLEQRITEYSYLSPDISLPTTIRSASVFTGAESEYRISYDSGYRPIAVDHSGYDPDGNPVQRMTALAYDDSGRLIAIDGPRDDVNDVTTLSYYDCTGGGRCGRLASRTDAIGNTLYFTDYDLHGRLTRSRGGNGLETEYRYDARGRLIQILQTANDGAIRETTYRYDSAGNRIESVAPDGVRLAYSYDANRLLRSITDNIGARIDYDYDVKGNRSASRVIDPDGTLARSIRYEFGLRDTLDLVDSAGSITIIRHDAGGNPTETIDPNGHAQSSEYDALERMIRRIDALGGISQIAYDQQDRITRVTAPNGATIRFSHDDLGNLLREESADRGTVSYGYDAAGNIIARTDGRGISAHYNYDAANRLLGIDLPGTESDARFEYDSCSNGIGRLCTISDAGGIVTYSYDGFGNRIEERRTQGVNEYLTRYTYDNGDRPLSIAYPDGRQVEYRRDALGRIVSISTSVNGSLLTIITDTRYRSDGLITAMQYGNGLTEYRDYDLQGRLTDHSVAGTTWRYEYDTNGNITRLSQGVDNHDYQYDALDRLINEMSPADIIAYDYDANGNRTQLSGSGGTSYYDYTPETNRLNFTDGLPVTLDSVGNTLDDGTLQYDYTPAGRLSGVYQNGNLLARYQYNAIGQRAAKTTESGTIHYHYDQSGHLILETRGDGQPMRTYIWLDEMPVAQIGWRLGQGNGHANGIFKGKANPPASGNSWSEVVTWLHSDHLLTPRQGSDASGTMVWQWRGDAFGSILPDEDVDGDRKIVTVNLRFPGQYFDAETGLHYNYFRDYDPSTGRYIESDPIGLAGGLNTFAYALSNPISFSDRFGLLVDAYYDSTSGTVMVVDRDTGQIVAGSAVSGGVPYGDRLPNGAYEILEQARNPESFRLDPIDNNPRNDVHDPSGRDRFRLHEPGNTVGCIAAEDRNEWDDIRDLINNTRTDTVMDNAIPWWAPWRSPAPITRYGHLYVY